MPVAHTILGVLVDAPAHGYAIKKYLAAALPDGSALNDGQLYPALARMERDGWIHKEVVEQRRSPSKHLYHVTDAGREEFEHWLCGERASGVHSWKFDFLHRCAFFQHLAPDQVEEQVQEELARVSDTLQVLERLATELRLSEQDPYRRMILDYSIRTQRLRRDWLLELVDLVTQTRAPIAAAPNA